MPLKKPFQRTFRIQPLGVDLSLNMAFATAHREAIAASWGKTA